MILQLREPVLVSDVDATPWSDTVICLAVIIGICFCAYHYIKYLRS